MFNLSPQLWNGTPTPFLTFTSSNATITPAITLSGDGPCQWEVTEADGHQYFYNTNSFSHTRGVAGNMTVRLLNTMQVAPYVTTIEFNGDGIVSGISLLQIGLFANMISLILNDNQLTGDLSTITLPPKLVSLRLNVNLLTGNISSIVLPSTLSFVYLNNNQLTGNLASVALPSGLLQFLINSNQLIGNLSTVTIPSGLTSLFLDSNQFSGLYTIPNLTALVTLRGQNQGAANMTQAQVDAFVSAWYAKWAAGAFLSNCTANIGGTNANPSGTYQNPFPNPPSTPLEMIYVMVNDPFATGNKTQIWTY